MGNYSSNDKIAIATFDSLKQRITQGCYPGTQVSYRRMLNHIKVHHQAVMAEDIGAVYLFEHLMTNSFRVYEYIHVWKPDADFDFGTHEMFYRCISCDDDYIEYRHFPQLTLQTFTNLYIHI